MATSRHFAFNPSPVTPTGATQFGNVCVATTGWVLDTGGLKWWNGPNEDNGYIICHIESTPKTAASFSEVISGTSVGFWRSVAKTESSFLELVERRTGQIFGTGSDARNWLHSNGYFTSYSVFSIVSGTKNPVLGNGGQSPFPASSWTSIRNASEDDTSTQVNLQFNITFNGTTYNSFFPNSNFYITFGSGSSQYSGLAANSPALDKIFFGGKDNSWQRVSSTQSDDKYLRLRWEGNNTTSGTPGSPGVVYELTFFNPIYTNNENWIELLIGNNNMPGQGISGIYSSTALLTGGQIVPENVGVAALQSYVFAGNSTGTNWTVYTGYHIGGTDY